MFAAADAEDAQAEPDYQQMLAKALGANTWESDDEVHEAPGQPSSSSQNPHIANSDPYGACDSMDDADDDEVEDESSDGAPEKKQTRGRGAAQEFLASGMDIDQFVETKGTTFTVVRAVVDSFSPVQVSV